MFVTFSVFLSLSAPARTELVGTATTISGDTIEIQGQRVRLYGVTSPTMDQFCVSARAQWRCGMVAKLKLGERMGTSTVVCQQQGADRHGRILARCRTDDGRGGELNRWLVTSGWAFASGDHGQGYEQAEEQAASSGAGLWRDGFVPSDQWRRDAERAERNPGDDAVDCSSCTLRHRALDEAGAGRKTGSATE